jgi:hypothetical protein
VAVSLYAAPSLADGQPPAQQIVDAVNARTVAISGYTADLSLHVAMHTFPFLSMSVRGSAAYTRPGLYDVRLRSLPMIARAFGDVSGDAGDPSMWQRKYVVAIDRSAPATPGLIALRMTQRNPGQIDHAEALIDVATMTVVRMAWYYENGGSITVDEHYAPVGRYLMVDSQTAEIEMPHVRATATADLSGYVLQSDVAVRP